MQVPETFEELKALLRREEESYKKLMKKIQVLRMEIQLIEKDYEKTMHRVKRLDKKKPMRKSKHWMYLIFVLWNKFLNLEFFLIRGYKCE